MATSPKLVKSSPQSPSLEQLETSVLVDMLGPLEEELDIAAARLAPTKKRAEAIGKILKERAAGPDAQTMDGKLFFALMGQRDNETSIDVPKVFKKLPRSIFFAICKIGLEKLRAVEPGWEKLVKQEHTGPRKVTTHRQPSEPEKAA